MPEELIIYDNNLIYCNYGLPGCKQPSIQRWTLTYRYGDTSFTSFLRNPHGKPWGLIWSIPTVITLFKGLLLSTYPFPCKGIHRAFCCLTLVRTLCAFVVLSPLNTTFLRPLELTPVEHLCFRFSHHPAAQVHKGYLEYIGQYLTWIH